MLSTTLARDGVNLSFSNLSNSTPILYLDVGNTRVGVNNSAPAYTLDVTGTINANANITGANVSTVGNVVAGNVVTSSIVSTSPASLTIATTSNGNILLTPNGTGFTKAVGTNGFVIPVGNTAQRPSPVDTGTIRFNTSTVQTEVWDGSQWVSATGATSAIVNQTISTADGTTTTFSLSYSATAESILVTLNGVMQTPTTAYTTNTGALTITFTEAPASGDIIQIRYIAATTVLAALVNGTSNVAIPISGGNVTISSGGTSNVLTVASTGATVAGTLLATTISTSGNVTAGNLIGTLVGNVSGNTTGTSVSVTGNVTANYFVGNISTNNIINSGSNLTGNIGSATTYFNTVFAKATSAQYADLAEFYAADAEYAPGTVVSFGGTQEVTLTTDDADPCIAGVVSTNPSYMMNAGLYAEYRTAVALTGRVPCQVVGPVTKGAMMVSAGNGAARAERNPQMGTVIGKALEAFDGDFGTIEIVVGRL